MVHIRYKLTDKAIKAKKKKFTWRAIASYDELAVMDYLAEMPSLGATRKALIQRMNIPDDLFAQKELARDLRKLMQRGYIEREWPTSIVPITERPTGLGRSKSPRITPKTPRLRR